jgi:tRNA(Ser,Leu) C12 N-acetylase TAN1
VRNYPAAISAFLAALELDLAVKTPGLSLREPLRLQLKAALESMDAQEAAREAAHEALRGAELAVDEQDYSAALDCYEEAQSHLEAASDESLETKCVKGVSRVLAAVKAAQAEGNAKLAEGEHALASNQFDEAMKSFVAGLVHGRHDNELRSRLHTSLQSANLLKDQQESRDRVAAAAEHLEKEVARVAAEGVAAGASARHQAAAVELELSKLYAEQPAEYSARTSAALSHLGVTLLMM